MCCLALLSASAGGDIDVREKEVQKKRDMIMTKLIQHLEVGRPKFRAVPEGVVENKDDPAKDLFFKPIGSIVEAKDGSLMLIQERVSLKECENLTSKRISTDGGKTWSDPVPLKSKISALGLVRLQSGKLSMYGRKKSEQKGRVCFSTSQDDGDTWTPAVELPTYQGFKPLYHSMIQLKSGRLLLVGYWQGLDVAASDAVRFAQSGAGMWRGLRLVFDGHRRVEMGVCIAYYSDDEGLTWRQCEGGLFGWFDERGVPNGEGGIIDVYEPTAAETKDGRVLMFLRSKTGRVLQSYSKDGGQTWNSIRPTELSSSQAPPMLVAIPSTGDLLCIWNQVSCEEIRRGFMRGRLSSAISRDSGMTWGNFKTIELQEGMEDVARIIPEFPIARRVVASTPLEHIPDGFSMFTYCNVDIIGDKVFVRYTRTWPRKMESSKKVSGDGKFPSMIDEDLQKEAQMLGEWVMRIYPLKWFYQE